MNDKERLSMSLFLYSPPLSLSLVSLECGNFCRSTQGDGQLQRIIEIRELV